MKPDWKWINIFLRDMFLAIVISWVNYKVDFQSWWVAFLMGALFVLVTWHLNDYIKLHKRIKL